MTKYIAKDKDGFFMNEDNKIDFDVFNFPTKEAAQFACDHSPVRGFKVYEVEVADEIDYSEYDNNDAPTQEEVESCRDWGSPYDYSEGAPSIEEQQYQHEMNEERF